MEAVVVVVVVVVVEAVVVVVVVVLAAVVTVMLHCRGAGCGFLTFSGNIFTIFSATSSL